MNPTMCTGMYFNPRMHTGIASQYSPYAYGDRDESPYAYRDRLYPCMHTGIMCHAIPVCIRGLNLITVCIRGSYRSLYAYRDRRTPITVCIREFSWIPVCIRGSRWSQYAYGDRMTLIPVCIRGFVRCLYAYGDISVTNRMHNEIVSIWEIKSCIPICKIMHMGIAGDPRMHTGGDR